MCVWEDSGTGGLILRNSPEKSSLSVALSVFFFAFGLVSDANQQFFCRRGEHDEGGPTAGIGGREEDDQHCVARERPITRPGEDV